MIRKIPTVALLIGALAIAGRRAHSGGNDAGVGAIVGTAIVGSALINANRPVYLEHQQPVYAQPVYAQPAPVYAAPPPTGLLPAGSGLCAATDLLPSGTGLLPLPVVITDLRVVTLALRMATMARVTVTTDTVRRDPLAGDDAFKTLCRPASRKH